MILFPAIDLKNGECVRLVRGDMAQATVAWQQRIGDLGLRAMDLDLEARLQRLEFPECPSAISDT